MTNSPVRCVRRRLRLPGQALRISGELMKRLIVLILIAAAMSIAKSSEGQSNDELARQVRAAEIAFARTSSADLRRAYEEVDRPYPDSRCDVDREIERGSKQ